MLSNELRLGNWVNVDGKAVRVESIVESGINLIVDPDHVPEHYIQHVSGIPISKEILLKCGFVKEIYERYYLRVNGFTIEYAFVNSYLFGTSLNGLHMKANLEFVHQLQNLYFALTGEELEVKL